MMKCQKTFLFLSLLLLVWGVGCEPERLTDQQKQHRIATLMGEYAQHFPEVPGLTTEQVQERLAEGAVLVDARTAAEQAVSRIPGAVLLEEVERELEQYQDKALIVYCTIGARSGEQAREWRAAGLDASNYEGSILAWTHAGGELVTPTGEPTREVHVYGAKWALQASGYEAVW